MDTPAEWAETVMEDFDSFLIDHAACERKASANGLSFVVRYPDRKALIGPMIEFAQEELEHFKMVYAWVERRGLTLTPDEKDPYLGGLIKAVRTGREERLLDRLVVGGVAEARGCERFLLLAEALPEGELKDFYGEIYRAEARHAGFFIRMARHYFSEEEIQDRVDVFLDVDATLVRTLPIRAAVH